MTDSIFLTIPLKNIVESKTNPRRRFDQKSLDEMAESIKEHMVIQPILVRPLPGKKKDRFEIVFGACRFRASHIAKEKDIPAIIRDINDEEVLELQIIENLQRQDIHPLDEAEGYRVLMDKTGQDVEAVAMKVGKSTSYIYQRLKLDDLTDGVKAAFFDDKLTAGHAILIARLQPKDQKDALRFTINEWDSPSVRELREWVETEIHRELKKAPFDIKDPGLVAKAGSCIDCPKRTGYQPELFPDFKKKDSCTDGDCWATKVTARLGQVRAKHKDEKLLEISTRYTPPGDNVLGYNMWEKVPRNKPCESMKKALVVEGNSSDATIGQVINVCTNKRCRKHWGQSMAPKTAKKSPAQLSAERKKKAEEISRKQALPLIIEKAKKIDSFALLLIIRNQVDTLWGDELKIIAERRNWAPAGKKPGTVDWEKLVMAKAEELSDSKLMLLAFELACHGDTFQARLGKVDYLKQAADYYDVDMKALKKDELAKLTAEHKLKTKKKAKKKASKKVSKKTKKKVAKKKATKKVQSSANGGK